jgi:hypothetical protein
MLNNGPKDARADFADFPSDDDDLWNDVRCPTDVAH